MTHFPRPLQLAPDVVLQVIGDEALILKLDEEVVFSLNSTGARIAQLVAGGSVVAAVVDHLSAEYGVGPADVEGEVVDLVRTLIARGLLVASPSEPPE